LKNAVIFVENATVYAENAVFVKCPKNADKNAAAESRFSRGTG